MKIPEISASLYIVSTPIGSASDISLRAIYILRSADVLVAEDTRVLRRLMQIHEISLARRTIITYNDHNGQLQRPKIISLIKKGKSVAMVTDAGTPTIADPGYRLVEEVVSHRLPVTSVPGASAVLSALMVAGLPTNNFFFGGFVPNRRPAKEMFFSQMVNIPSTAVFYESPSRLLKTLRTIEKIYGSDNKIVVCRELTKKFEEICRGSILELIQFFESVEKIKGEIVIVLGRPKICPTKNDEIDFLLLELMRKMSFKDAVVEVTQVLEVSKKIVYKRGLSLIK